MNPYNCAKPGNQFVGYEEERRNLLDGFRNGNSFAIIGGRRIGKTSLLMQIEKDIEERGIDNFNPRVVRFSFQEFDPNLTSEELFKYLFDNIVKSLKPKLLWDSNLGSFSYDRFRENLIKVEFALKKFIGNNWLVIFLIDEMDGALKRLSDGSFFENLRHLLMESDFQSHFRIVATGVNDMVKLIGSSSPLNNLVQKFMRPLEDSEAEELVKIGFPNIDQNDIFMLFKKTGKHPYLLQGILESYFKLSEESEKSIIRFDPDLLDKATFAFLNHHSDFQGWIDNISEKDISVYHTLAKSPDKIFTREELVNHVEVDNIFYCINILAYHGVIKAELMTEIQINGTLFLDWFLKKTKQNKTQKPIKEKGIPSGDNLIHILHLSDLHIENKDLANAYCTHLEADLLNELDVSKLDYIVLSGDIVISSTEMEYSAALKFIKRLKDQFKTEPNSLIIVPGNHDLNWEMSKKAYCFFYNESSPSEPSENCIQAGDYGKLVRNDDHYKDRFQNFYKHFYRKLLNNKAYPKGYYSQAVLSIHPNNKILFLSLNSSWQIDFHYKNRASICPIALSEAIEQLKDGDYTGWLKIAVFHHPVTGKDPMDDAFMQQLSLHGFNICLHGHVHEASAKLYDFDKSRQIHIIGAGTFGAPSKSQMPGIPLQYNLLKFDPDVNTITVVTRKKEKPEGAWKADSRWQDANDPKCWYTFKV